MGTVAHASFPLQVRPIQKLGTYLMVDALFWVPGDVTLGSGTQVRHDTGQEKLPVQ
jgi:hypothetical protein